MNTIRILTSDAETTRAGELAGLLQENGMAAVLVNVREDDANRQLAERLAGDLDPRYPLVIVGDPKIRLLIWEASREDVLRLAGRNGHSVAGTGEADGIRVYSTAWCPDCRHLKRHLDKHGVTYAEVNVEEDEEAMRWLLRRSGGRRVVPSLAAGPRMALFNPPTDMLDRVLGIAG